MVQSIHDVLASGSVRSVFQPLVALRDGATVGYEALARGPLDSPLESPGALFGEAREAGVVGLLDRHCRAAALRGALAAGLHPPGLLFVNVEPDHVLAPLGAEEQRLLAEGERRLQVVVELTERNLVRKPAEVIAAADAVRRRGWAVALDDVGAHWSSLALLWVLRPEVVKLDLDVVQRPGPEADRLVAAVRAYADATGALVVAEGIETPAHLERARAFGADIGQGWHFGRPGALPPAVACETFSSLAGALPEVAPVRRAVPSELAGERLAMAVAPKKDLMAISFAVERAAAGAGSPPIVLGAFQTADRFTPATARRYAGLAARAGFVGAFGTGLSTEPAPGVRGASPPDNHRMAGEWSVVCLTPERATALLARDLGDRGPDRLRRFSYAITDDRELVAEVARTLMHRVVSWADDDATASAVLSERALAGGPVGV